MKKSSGRYFVDSCVGEKDLEVLRKSHKFIRDEEEGTRPSNDSYGDRVAKKYYAKLYKEFAVVDLSRYRTGEIGLRWRTRKEIIAGIGRFTCGSKTCDETQALFSFECPFKYREEGRSKSALVKVVLCPDCAYKLNFKRSHRRVEKDKDSRRHRRRRREEEDAEGERVSDSTKKKKRSHAGDKMRKKTKKKKKKAELEASIGASE